MTEILLPEGRIVGGHPITMKPKLDDNKMPVMQKGTMTPVTEAYVGYAIPKQGEAHWNQTEWGAKIWAEGQAAYPTMIQRPDFSWKIVDGDSPVPNKRGVVPNTREGYPGHWVVSLTSQFGINCFHFGRYAPHEQIIDENEIKTGDYGIMYINCTGNNKNNVPAKTPGVYVNPKHFVMTRAGAIIVTDTGPSAAEVFAGIQAPAGMPAAPVGMPAAPVGMPAAPVGMPAAPVSPAHDFVQAAAVAPAPVAPTPAPVAERTFVVQGNTYTESQLRAAGWGDAQIATLG